MTANETPEPKLELLMTDAGIRVPVGEDASAEWSCVVSVSVEVEEASEHGHASSLTLLLEAPWCECMTHYDRDQYRGRRAA